MISASDKSMLREGVTKLQKKILESNKKAGSENKRKATEAALEAAKAAASSGTGYLVSKLDVGLDTKAVQEAYKAVQDAHPTLPSLFITADYTGILSFSFPRNAVLFLTQWKANRAYFCHQKTSRDVSKHSVTGSSLASSSNGDILIISLD